MHAPVERAGNHLVVLREEAHGAGVLHGDWPPAGLQHGFDLGGEPIDPLSLAEHVTLRAAGRVGRVLHGPGLALAMFAQHPNVDAVLQGPAQEAVDRRFQFLDPDGVILSRVDILSHDGLLALRGGEVAQGIVVQSPEVAIVFEVDGQVGAEVGQAELGGLLIQACGEEVHAPLIADPQGVDVPERRGAEVLEFAHLDGGTVGVDGPPAEADGSGRPADHGLRGQGMGRHENGTILTAVPFPAGRLAGRLLMERGEGEADRRGPARGKAGQPIPFWLGSWARRAVPFEDCNRPAFIGQAFRAAGLGCGLFHAGEGDGRARALGLGRYPRRFVRRREKPPLRPPGGLALLHAMPGLRGPLGRHRPGKADQRPNDQRQCQTIAGHSGLDQGLKRGQSSGSFCCGGRWPRPTSRWNHACRMLKEHRDSDAQTGAGQERLRQAVSPMGRRQALPGGNSQRSKAILPEIGSHP